MSKPQRWLITGGAGYIGAHVADAFLATGKEVIIYDSLYRGFESRIEFLSRKYNKVIPLIAADIRDTKVFANTLEQYCPIGIVHTAALKAVGESMENPDEYYDVNFNATKKILEIIESHRINKVIFSSTAAVYGSPGHSNPIKEDAEKKPISPYGASKLSAEDEVNKFLAKPGNNGTSLRFFNVVGTAAPELIDKSVANLIPIVFNKLKAGEPPIIFGTDYQTSDGSCIRDYVDVRDIAFAHLAAADSKLDMPPAMNVGTGKGRSVREVIKLLSDTCGFTNVVVLEDSRRAGDPACLCADVSLILSTLEFTSKYTLEMSIADFYRQISSKQHL